MYHFLYRLLSRIREKESRVPEVLNAQEQNGKECQLESVWKRHKLYVAESASVKKYFLSSPIWLPAGCFESHPNFYFKMIDDADRVTDNFPLATTTNTQRSSFFRLSWLSSSNDFEVRTSNRAANRHSRHSRVARSNGCHHHHSRNRSASG